MPYFRRFPPARSLPARLVLAAAMTTLVASCAAPRPISGYSDGSSAGSAGAGAVSMQGECSSAANCNKNKI